MIKGDGCRKGSRKEREWGGNKGVPGTGVDVREVPMFRKSNKNIQQSAMRK